jgi:diguanylate cyclase (GGDEF)-like protein
MNITTILIVDDSEVGRFILSELLEEHGYRVISAANGIEALEVAREGQPDVIISDIMMPEMDGYCLCIECLEDPILKKIPFIFHSATYTEPEDEVLAMSMGGTLYIAKPIEPEQLIKAIQDVGNLDSRERLSKTPEELRKLYHNRVVKMLEKKTAELEKSQTVRKELLQMAHYDALTGLPNRALLFEFLANILNQARRRDKIVGILFLDLNDFKQVNDTYGHDVGDQLLCETGVRIKRVLREEDLVARIGGDEFIAVLPTISDEADSKTVAKKISAVINMPFHIANNECRVGVSIGISTFPQDGGDAETLISVADQSMYKRKNG